MYVLAFKNKINSYKENSVWMSVYFQLTLAQVTIKNDSLRDVFLATFAVESVRIYFKKLTSLKYK